MALSPAWAANSGDYNIYWGDLHGHTMMSPVELTPQIITNYILYARDTKGLDFVALTEKDFDLTDADWNDCRALASAYTDSDNFIAFTAFEWGDEGFDDFGHRVVLYKTDNQPLFRSDASTSDHVSELLDRVLNLTNGLTDVAHPDLSNYLTDWDYFDGASDRVSEIYSRNGHFEEGDHGIQQALALGYRFGFIAVSDSRSGTPGSHGLTAILTTSLKKDNLHEALHARRVYATTGARIGLWFSADGHEMGSEFASSTGPALSVECTPTAPLERIEILKNNNVVYTWFPGGSALTPVAEWSSDRSSQEELVSSKASWDEASAGTEEGVEELTAALTDGIHRLQQTFNVTDPTGHFVVHPGVTGDYRLWVNSELLVDTRQLEPIPEHPNHDCFGPDGVGLVGSLENFHRLGFYDLQSLGVTLRAGENVVELESRSGLPTVSAQGSTASLLENATAAAPVEFIWADAGFSGPSYYYLRVTQTDGEQAWASPIWVDRLAPDSTPPEAATKLRAYKEQDDVYLDWPKVARDVDGNIESVAYYRVFRGTTPDFVPDRVGLSNQIGTSSKTRYSDSNALLDNSDYYYRVVAVDEDGNESVGLSNLASKITLPMTFSGDQSNIHWVSLPWEAIYTNAEELERDLNAGQNDNCTKVFGWDIASQAPACWVRYDGQWVGTNFDLMPGQAVGITIQDDMDVILVGSHDEGTAMRLTPHPSGLSTNWISLPVHSPHFFASSLVNDINEGAFPTVVSRITRFTANQVYQTYEYTGGVWSGTNFILMPGDAYAVEVETVFDWVPDTLDD
jgi:hypothetical protein